MPKFAGGLLRQKIVTETSSANGLQVSWKWYNEAQGLVEWTFTNPTNAVGTVILFRNGYYFGNAFYPVYEATPGFGVSWAQNLDPLVDNGVENNSPPIGIVQWASGQRIVCFLFTIAPNSSWSMLEGGFSSIITPSGIALYDVTLNTTGQFCCQYDPAQVTAWQEQTGTNYQGWSPNPSTFTTVLVNAPSNAPYVELFSGDSETNGPCQSSGGGGGGQSCLQMIEQGIADNNPQEIIEGILCLIDNGGLSVSALIGSIADHQLKKRGETLEQSIDKLGEDVKRFVGGLLGKF